MNKEHLFIKIMIATLFFAGLLIGLAISSGKECPEEQYNRQDSFLTTYNSPIFIEEYSLATKMLAEKIIFCESSGDHSKIGDWHYEYQAYGIAQFQIRTFDWLKGLAGMDYLEIENEQDQRILLEWALENGYGYLWTCYHKAYNN
ncbi:MAG TPA: hypothetical protein PL092_03145 [Candidatus Pacearchaeota archaeon]|jgi:hypothetical protein|nr:hypothetical protein [Candidatus Pacearchaeota archaeon]